MAYSNIKRVLAAALLLAFTAPSTLAITGYGNADAVPYIRTMNLSNEIKLVDSDERITLSLRDSDAKQVLRMFADKVGKNIVFHSSVEGKVTLDLVDTPINEAFNLVLQVTGLSYYLQGNTMIVMAKDAPDNATYSKQEMLVFPVKYVSAEKIAAFLNKNVFGMQKPGMSAVEAATVNSATNELIVFGMPNDVPIIQKVIEQFDKEPLTKTFAVNHTTPAEMASMICSMLLPSRGIGSSQGSSGGSASTIFDAGDMTGGAADIGGSSGTGNLKLGEGVIACSVSPTAAGSLAPFDVQNLSVAYFPQRGTITIMGGSEVQAVMIENFIKANDVKQPQALLELSIVELSEQGSKEFQNQWHITGGPWTFSFDGASTGGGRTPRRFSNFIPVVDYIWNSPEGTSKPYPQDGKNVVPTQTKREYMSAVPRNTHITWMMNYLIENRKARVLANPKIMITNGQESVIDLTQDYVEKVTSEYLTSSSTDGNSTGTAQKNYTIGKDLGIKVSLTPFISPEGYVTINVKPNYSTVAGEVRSLSEVENQTDLVATLLSRRDLDLKNIRIKDGETLVIGGLIQETEQKTVNKVPFLGDLPLIGPLFRSTSTSKAKSELVIMITPKIINDGEGTIADTL